MPQKLVLHELANRQDGHRHYRSRHETAFPQSINKSVCPKDAYEKTVRLGAQDSQTPHCHSRCSPSRLGKKADRAWRCNPPLPHWPIVRYKTFDHLPALAHHTHWVAIHQALHHHIQSPQISEWQTPNLQYLDTHAASLSSWPQLLQYWYSRSIQYRWYDN